MNDEMVDDFVDEPNVPNNAIGGCGCLSFLRVEQLSIDDVWRLLTQLIADL